MFGRQNMRSVFFKIQLRVFFFSLLLFAFAGCEKDTISLDYAELNTAADTKLRGIYFLNETIGFVCGGEKNQSGIILKTTDGGSNWQKVYSGTLALRDITFVNDSLGFACGDSVLILKTIDGGATWNKLPLPFTPVHITPFTSIQFTDAEHGYVCGGENWESGLAFRTHDGGINWDYQAFYSTEITENFFVNDTTGFLSANGAVYKATSDFLVFDLLAPEGDLFTSVCFTSADEGFVCGYEGSIYKTTDAGANWKQVREGNSAFSQAVHFNKVRFAGSTKGLAVGVDGAVFYSDDAGENWKQSNNFPDATIYSAFVLNATTLYLSGEGGKVYKLGL